MKNFLKKSAAITLAITLALGLTACAKSTDDPEKDKTIVTEKDQNESEGAGTTVKPQENENDNPEIENLPDYSHYFGQKVSELPDDVKNNLVLNYYETNLDRILGGIWNYNYIVDKDNIVLRENWFWPISLNIDNSYVGATSTLGITISDDVSLIVYNDELNKVPLKDAIVVGYLIDNVTEDCVKHRASEFQVIANESNTTYYKENFPLIEYCYINQEDEEDNVYYTGQRTHALLHKIGLEFDEILKVKDNVLFSCKNNDYTQHPANSDCDTAISVDMFGKKFSFIHEPGKNSYVYGTVWNYENPYHHQNYELAEHTDEIGQVEITYRESSTGDSYDFTIYDYDQLLTEEYMSKFNESYEEKEKKYWRLIDDNEEYQLWARYNAYTPSGEAKLYEVKLYDKSLNMWIDVDTMIFNTNTSSGRDIDFEKDAASLLNALEAVRISIVLPEESIDDARNELIEKYKKN